MGNIIEKIKALIEVNLKMENIMESAKNIFQMIHFLMVFSQMVLKDMELMYLKMVVNIRENFQIMFFMEKVLIHGQIKKFMMEIGKMEK